MLPPNTKNSMSTDTKNSTRKINVASTKAKGSATTEKGIAPPDQMKLFKFKNGTPYGDLGGRNINHKVIKRDIQDWKLLRMLMFKTPYRKMPSTLKMAIQWLNKPVENSRTDRRDARAEAGEIVNQQSVPVTTG